MVKPRINRVPMMLSEEELSAIDDWRFKSRVATRSDAIRRLCQMGIAIDSREKELRRISIHAHQTADDLAGGAYDRDKEVDLDWVMEKILMNLEHVNTVMMIIDETIAAVSELKKGSTVEEAMNAANAAANIHREDRERYIKAMDTMRNMNFEN